MLGKDVSHDHLAQAIRAISTPILNKPIGQISLAKLLGQILGLSKEFNIEVQPQFTLLQKTMLMAEGTTRQINPNINMWELSGPLIDKWINESHDPFKTLEDWVHKNKILLLKIPEIMHKIDKLITNKFLFLYRKRKKIALYIPVTKRPRLFVKIFAFFINSGEARRGA